MARPRAIGRDRTQPIFTQPRPIPDIGEMRPRAGSNGHRNGPTDPPSPNVPKLHSMVLRLTINFPIGELRLKPSEPNGHSFDGALNGGQ